MLAAGGMWGCRAIQAAAVRQETLIATEPASLPALIDCWSSSHDSHTMAPLCAARRERDTSCELPAKHWLILYIFKMLTAYASSRAAAFRRDTRIDCVQRVIIGMSRAEFYQHCKNSQFKPNYINVYLLLRIKPVKNEYIYKWCC